MKYSILSKLFGLILLSLCAASFAAAPDDLEQRLAACTQCHGHKGAGMESDVITPRLAGKPADYLYKQLQAFQAGTRDNAAMEYVIRQLTPDYLKTIAHYYADQHVVFQPVPISGVSEEELKRGEYLVKYGDPARSVPACEQCHGNTLTGVNPSIPGIIGQPYEYIKNQLDSWRQNTRSTKSTHCMWVVATRMQANDVKAVSAWLASQTVPENDRPVELSDLPKALPGWCIFEQQEVSL